MKVHSSGLKKKRGFATLSKEKRVGLAAKGGKQAHKLGKAHTFSEAEARKWGSVGGRAGKLKREEQDKILDFYLEKLGEDL